jgi:hypothetical protein
MNEIDLLKAFRDDMPEPTTDAWVRARAAIAAAGAESGGTGTGRTRIRWLRPLYVVTLALVAAVAAASGALLSQRPSSADAGALDAVRAMVADAIRGGADNIVLTQSRTVLSNGTVYTGVSWDYPWTGEPGSTVSQTGLELEGGSPIRGWALWFTVPQSSRLSAGSDCQLTPHGTTVDYTYHTWQAAPPPCVMLPPGLDMFVPTLRIIGYPVLDNQKTVEFQSVSKTQTFTFWISTVNDLPLQSQTTQKDWTNREQYTYLMPTPANKAKLKLTVPAGYAQTLVQGAAS